MSGTTRDRGRGTLRDIKREGRGTLRDIERGRERDFERH